MYKVIATVKPAIGRRVGAGTLSREYSVDHEPTAEELRVVRREAEGDFKTLYGCSGTADITVRRA